MEHLDSTAILSAITSGCRIGHEPSIEAARRILKDLAQKPAEELARTLKALRPMLETEERANKFYLQYLSHADDSVAQWLTKGPLVSSWIEDAQPMTEAEVATFLILHEYKYYRVYPCGYIDDMAKRAVNKLDLDIAQSHVTKLGASQR